MSCKRHNTPFFVMP